MTSLHRRVAGGVHHAAVRAEVHEPPAPRRLAVRALHDGQGVGRLHLQPRELEDAVHPERAVEVPRLLRADELRIGPVPVNPS